MRHLVFLFRGCRRPAAHFALLVRRLPVPARLPAVRWCFSPPAAAPASPHPTPHLRLLSSAPPVCSLVSPVGRRLCPAPPPGGLRFSASGVLHRVFPCCLRALWLLCAAVPFVGALCCPPPPRVCFLRVSSPCRLFSCVPLLHALFFPVPLALVPVWLGFFFPPWLAASRRCVHCVLVRPPPPPLGCCSWWRAVLHVLLCSAAVECGLFCAARGVLLRRVVLLCGCLAVRCVVLPCCWLCRWASPVGVGRGVSVPAAAP